MMNPACKSLVALLAGLALAGCGGGGGDGGGATSPPQNGQIVLSPTTTTLPLNPGNILPYVGSPYMAEVGITFRNAAGTIMSPEGDATVTINPPSVVTLSPPDDPETDDINEMAQRIVTFPITLNNGSAVIFATAYDVAGTAILTASAVDPITGRTVSTTLEFTVSTGVGPMPASVEAAANPALVYAPSSGGQSSTLIRALVRDGGGQLVADPGSGNDITDNLKFEIIGDAGGATLSTQSAGGPANGTSVTTHTIRGVASAAVQVTDATSQDAPLQIRITADGADNDVANGITNPVSTTVNVIVTDGELFSVVITSPDSESIAVNAVASGITVDGTEIPPRPDGTYSLTVSAQGQDRHGNPVVPGTEIQFGVIDGPMVGFPGLGIGSFLVAGNDGDPQESGTLFTAPTGDFRNAGPGDTLLVFGQSVPGNRDLESARTVQRINGINSLNVAYRFNPNDETGGSVNNGPVIPYVVGHAEEGNIGAAASTDQNGVATTTLNYPVSRLGKNAYIWARGAGSPVGGTARLVTDISGAGFPGVAPAVLAVSPSPIPGNSTVQIQVCLTDALGSGIQGAAIGFGFQDVGGTAMIDGQTNSGFLASATAGQSGCAFAEVTTSGVASDSASVTFTAGTAASINIPIAPPSALVLQVSPSSLSGNGGGVSLRLTDGSGAPQAGVQIAVECAAGASSGFIAPTNASGTTSASITIVNQYGSEVSGTCTFTAGGEGGASATLNFQGFDLCTTDPDNGACEDDGGATPPAEFVLSLVLVRGTSTSAVAVTSQPAGLSCNLAADATDSLCSAEYVDGSTVLLNAGFDAGTTITPSGTCTPLGVPTATSATFQVTMSSAQTCNLTAN